MRDDEFDDEPYLIIEKNNGSVGSFLVGVAIGAGVALLLAPQDRRGDARRHRAAGAAGARPRTRFR